MKSIAIYKRILAVAGLLTLLTVFFLFNPEQSSWFPKCPFHLYTGLQCPGCGIQRATYQLLHFHLLDAIKYNFFLVISVPYILLLFITTYLAPKDKLVKLRNFCYNAKTIWVYLSLTIIWWVGRNILSI